jgi:hypothetical protein
MMIQLRNLTSHISATALLLLGIPCLAQQVPDTAYAPKDFTPRYATGAGPAVTIDEAHHNFHTADGRYLSFARLLASDGYKIAKGLEPFSAAALKGAKILVVSNALNEANETEWSLPTPSAFTPAEIEAVKSWVAAGGSLFLIADHMPFAGAAADMAKAFGVTFYNGFALDSANGSNPDAFSLANGRLHTESLPDLKEVNSITTFTGQAFDLPTDATSLLTLDKNFAVLLPATAWQFNKDTKHVLAAGKSQLAYLSFGKGRVVMSGEAAMFSAQLAGPERRGMGMNTPEAAQNHKLLLALVHWLDGVKRQE